MRILPTRLHGVLDYLVSAVLINSPWLFGFADGGGARMWVPIVLGSGSIVYSLLTDYELGIVHDHAIQMSAHLFLDLASGVVLAASPWLFGFADEVKWPHVIIGLFEITAALITRKHSGFGERHNMGRPSTTRLAS